MNGSKEPASEKETSMRARTTRFGLVSRLLVVLLTGTVIGLGAPPAMATHEEACPAYTSAEGSAVDDQVIAESVVTFLEMTHDILAAVQDIVGEKAKKAGFPANIGLLVAEFFLKIATVASTVLVFAAKTALLVVTTINNIADECRISRHLAMSDELVKSAIRRDLGVTTTPVALFVLPEEEGGFIDGGDAAGNGGVGVAAIVRETIDKMKRLAQCTCTSADAYYEKGVSEMGNGAYKSAYKYFRQAYVLAFSN